MISDRSQATYHYNDVPHHVISTVHKGFTSDNQQNQRNYPISFNTVVYRIVYYQQLIEGACDVLVKGERVPKVGSRAGGRVGRVAHLYIVSDRDARDKSECERDVSGMDGRRQGGSGGWTGRSTRYIPLISPPHKKASL